jgi:hypothetical protein
MTSEQGAEMGNRITGEDRDHLTAKLTLADRNSNTSLTFPIEPEFFADIRRHLDGDWYVLRSWLVLWAADGGQPRTVVDTDYLPDPERVRAYERAAAAREQDPAL